MPPRSQGGSSPSLCFGCQLGPAPRESLAPLSPPHPCPGPPCGPAGGGGAEAGAGGGGAAWCCRAACAVGWLRPQAPVFWTSWPVTESGKAGHGGKRGGWPPEASRAEPAFGGPYSSRRVLMRDDVSSEASMGLFGEEEECCVQSGAGSAKRGAHIPEGVEDSPWGPGKGVFRLMFPFNEGEICAALSTSMPMNSGP